MLAIGAGRRRFVAVRAHWTRRLPSVGQIGLMKIPWCMVQCAIYTLNAEDRPRDARPSLVSSSFAGGSMFPPSLWRSRESLAGSDGHTQARLGTDWIAAEFVRHLHRGAAEVDNSPLLAVQSSLPHTFTPQPHHLLLSSSNIVHPADEGTLHSPTYSLNPAQ